jgi:RNA polymerase sigma-70 factor (ECF subfamily)
MHADNDDTALTALLERVARQDQAALKPLYDACSGKLYGLAMRVVGQRELAEDVLQEAFLTIWRSAPDYVSSLSPPMAWMGLIVRSRALDIFRRRKSEGSQLTQELDDELTQKLASEAPGPADMAQSGQQSSALNGCLQQLENKQLEVLSLAYLRDLSHGELAQQLGLPLGTVKTWIRRGLEQLRLCMARFI